MIRVVTLISLLFFSIVLFSFSSSSLAMTVGEEKELGEKLLFTARKNFKLLDDPDISQYMNNLGRSVLNVAGPQFFDYRFFVVKNDEFNAFAAPSGLIFFFTGLIETTKTEDELISVMAHEIGHVGSRHIADKLEKDRTITATTLALAVASLALGNTALSQGLFTGSLAAGQTMSLSYSRQNEEEADRLAFRWMQKMHRDPHAMEEMLKTMRRIARYRSGQIPAYLMTHPNPEIRLDYIDSLLDTESTKTAQYYYEKTDNFDFLRIKYRILVEVKEGQDLRNYFTNIMNSNNDAESRTMAEYGLSLLETKEFDYKNALAHIQDVRKHYPDKNSLKVDHGIILMEEGFLPEALALLQQAVNSDKNDMNAAFQLGRAFALSGKNKEAKELFMRVKVVMPEYSRLYFELGRLEADAGKQGLSFYYLGMYYMYEGELKLAKQSLEKALSEGGIPESIKEDIDFQLERIEKQKS